VSAPAASATTRSSTIPPLDATFAQLGPDEKHAVSHRGIAMARARALLMDWRRAGAAS
jgi:hypothetical protein